MSTLGLLKYPPSTRSFIILNSPLSSSSKVHSISVSSQYAQVSPPPPPHRRTPTTTENNFVQATRLELSYGFVITGPLYDKLHTLKSEGHYTDVKNIGPVVNDGDHVRLWPRQTTWFLFLLFCLRFLCMFVCFFVTDIFTISHQHLEDVVKQECGIVCQSIWFSTSYCKPFCQSVEMHKDLYRMSLDSSFLIESIATRVWEKGSVLPFDYRTQGVGIYWYHLQVYGVTRSGIEPVTRLSCSGHLRCMTYYFEYHRQFRSQINKSELPTKVTSYGMLFYSSYTPPHNPRPDVS